MVRVIVGLPERPKDPVGHMLGDGDELRAPLGDSDPEVVGVARIVMTVSVGVKLEEMLAVVHTLVERE